MHAVYSVEVTEHMWIPMSDGTRLAARLWLPQGAKETPVPALLEYIPYRKSDMVRARDERNHPWFSAHGYACLRVDMRGSGDSEGHMPDMYAPNELEDAREVIAWIAAQPWCSGRVGMFGTSWGGTAALQANVSAPEALKAVIAVCATHDRYEDDIHHMGGCLLTDTLEWGATLPAILSAPPTPNVGAHWKAMWRDRMEVQTFPLEPWLREEARGTYWRHGSVVHQAKDLSRPILAIGGWADRYSNSVMGLANARPDLVWGVVGPWGHHYPDHGHPGPAMGFQSLALEWWDHWLKPKDKAPLDWPRLRIWMRDFDIPANAIDQRSGRWMELDTVARATHIRALDLGSSALPAVVAQPAAWVIPVDLNIGQSAGDTGYFGRSGGLPLDQVDEDARSLCFTTPVLEQDCVLCGSPRLRLTVASQDGSAVAEGQIVVRLNDIAPDGSVGRITYGVRNLALDENLDAPAEAHSCTQREVDLAFHSCAYRLRKGHRLRIALSGSYWPLIWPAVGGQPLSVVSGTLELPTLDTAPRPLSAALPPADDLPERKPFHSTVAPPLKRQRSVAPNGALRNAWHQPFTEVRYTEIDSAFGYETRFVHSVDPKDPLSASATVTHSARYCRPDGTALIDSHVDATCDAQAYHINATLIARWDGEVFATRSWHLSVPRRLS